VAGARIKAGHALAGAAPEAYLAGPALAGFRGFDFDPGECDIFAAMTWWQNVGAVITGIAGRLQQDVPHLAAAWRTLLGVAVVAFLFGIYYARRIAGGRSQYWRLSNASLRRKVVEFTSRLRHYAAGREREMRLAWQRGNVDPGDVAVNLKADYSGSFRVDAIGLREALDPNAR